MKTQALAICNAFKIWLLVKSSYTQLHHMYILYASREKVAGANITNYTPCHLKILSPSHTNTTYIQRNIGGREKKNREKTKHIPYTLSYNKILSHSSLCHHIRTRHSATSQQIHIVPSSHLPQDRTHVTSYHAHSFIQPFFFGKTNWTFIQNY